MAKKFHIENAKVEIDGQGGYRAHTWRLIMGIGKADIVIACHDLPEARKLTVDDNPNPDILLVDLCGVELRYSTELIGVKETPFDDGIDQIEYCFKIVG